MVPRFGAPAPESASQAAPRRGGRRKTALRKEATHRNKATGLAQQRDNPQKVHPRADNSNLVAQSERQHANIQFGLSRQVEIRRPHLLSSYNVGMPFGLIFALRG